MPPPSKKDPRAAARNPAPGRGRPGAQPAAEQEEPVPEEAVVSKDAPLESLFNGPAFLISAAVHLVLVLIAGSWVLEKMIQQEDAAVEIPWHPATEQVAVIEPPPPTVGQRGIPSDEPMQPSNNDEPSIFFPEAKPSDHNESADGEDYHQMKGDSRDFLSYIPGAAGGFRGRQNGPNAGVYDTMGVGAGGGGGGRYGGRYGGRENLVKVGGGDTRALSAVLFALRWLARHQNSDGGWSVQGFERNCGRYKFAGSCTPNRFTGSSNFDAGVSGLALLAFLGAGYTPSSHEKVFAGVPDSPTFGGVVKGALKHLLSIQTGDGLVGPSGDKYMYNHTICSLALTEAYGMTALPELKDPAQRAVDYLVRAKSPGAGWRYSYQCNETDSSVTGWAIMVLKSAEVADIKFDRSAYEDVKKYYSGVTGTVDYDKLWTKPKSMGTGAKSLAVTGYKSKDDAGSLVALQGVNETYDYTPALTAIMIMSRVFIDHKIADQANAAIDTLLAYLPQKWSPDDQGSWHLADFYYWYYASYALFQVTDPNDGRWKKWNEAMRSALVETQNVPPKFSQQCKEGAWEPVDRWACEGGRVYTTAIGALTLEVYYRYPKVAHK